MTGRRRVLDAIVGHSRRDPGHPAVKDPGAQLDYARLIEETRLLASGLAGEGVVAGDRIALHLPNSVGFVVAALACQWLGAIFVPLPMGDPLARLEVVIDDCRPALVVVPEGSGPGELPPAGRDRRRDMGALRASAAAGGAAGVADGGEAGEAAYMIYTSGTAGTPKGVVIGHDAFTAAVQSAVAALGLHPATRTLCVSPFHFDGSFATLFTTLYAGGSVVIRPRDALLYPRTFFNAVATERITYTGFSPSYLRLLVTSRQLSRLAGTDLDIVALGGEALSIRDVEALWEAAPQVRVFNRYGPTETAIAVTHYELTRDLAEEGVVPFGRPHPGVTFHLVDDEGALIEEPDRVGELYIGGNQLMMGYWDAPALTAEVLRTDVVAGRTLYRTGDLVSRQASGNYVYVGRADRVVKRSGVRISLIELGDALRGVERVSAAVCVAYDDDGQTGIAAFVVGEGREPLDPADIWRGARSRLPDTMLPNPVVVVERLPVTTSGKLDERRLLADAGLAPPRSV